MSNLYILLLTVLCCTLSLGVATTENNKPEFSIALLTPKVSADGGCTKKVMQMAIDNINKINLVTYLNKTDNSITQYKMVGYFAEAEPTKRDAIISLNKLYSVPPVKIATVGAPYDIQNAYITDFTYQYSFPYFSYNEVDLPFKQAVKIYFQTKSYIKEQFHAAAAFLRHFNWDSYNVIFDLNSDRYSGVDVIFFADMQRGLTKFNILAKEEIYSTTVEDTGEAQVEQMHKTGTRIYFALVGIIGARKIFCQAYKRKMYKQKILWIFFEILPKGWASDKYNMKVTSNGEKEREIQCSESELLTAAKGYISMVNANYRRDGKSTVSGMTVSDFKTKLNAIESDKKCPDNIGVIYDTVWAVAQTFTNFGNHSDILDYKYNYTIDQIDKPYRNKIADEIINTDFEGLSGRVNFHGIRSDLQTYAARDGLSDIFININEDTKIYIANYCNISKNIELVPNVNQILFDDTDVPDNKLFYAVVTLNFSEPLLTAFWVLSFIGILLTLLILCAVIFLFKHDACAINNSIYFEVPMIIGCMLCYLSVIIYGIDGRFINKDTIVEDKNTTGNRTVEAWIGTVQVCYSFLVTLMIGFSFTFGALFANIWQLYKRHVTPEMKVDHTDAEVKLKVYPDWILFVILTILISIDIIILITLGVKYPINSHVYNVSDEFTNTGMKQVNQIITCKCDKKIEYTIAIYSYKVLLLIFGVFFSWQTKEIKRKLKVETNPNEIAIYNIASISIIGIICTIVLFETTRLNALYAIVAVCVLICVTTTLLLVFGKKLRKFLLLVRQIKSRDNKTDKTKVKTGRMPVSIKKTTEEEPEQSELNNLPDKERGDSVTPSYLSCTNFMTPPSYSNEALQGESVNQDGILESNGIYVGEEVSETSEASEEKEDKNQAVDEKILGTTLKVPPMD